MDVFLSSFLQQWSGVLLGGGGQLTPSAAASRQTETRTNTQQREERERVLTQALMKLTRHRGHRGGWEAVDVERPHLVDLRGGERHAGCEVTAVARCHDGCLLLHELKKRATEKWGEERRGWVGG